MSSLLFNELFPVSLGTVPSPTQRKGGKGLKREMGKRSKFSSLLKLSGSGSRKVMVSQHFGLICWILGSSQVQDASMPRTLISWINPPPTSKEGPEVCLPREKAHTV